MKLCIGENPKTGKDEFVGVFAIPVPNAPNPNPNPNAHLWIDEQENVWRWTKYGPPSVITAVAEANKSHVHVSMGSLKQWVAECDAEWATKTPATIQRIQEYVDSENGKKNVIYCKEP